MSDLLTDYAMGLLREMGLNPDGTQRVAPQPASAPAPASLGYAAAVLSPPQPTPGCTLGRFPRSPSCCGDTCWRGVAADGDPAASAGMHPQAAPQPVRGNFQEPAIGGGVPTQMYAPAPGQPMYAPARKCYRHPRCRRSSIGSEGRSFDLC
jgi:hypothetical protein